MNKNNKEKMFIGAYACMKYDMAYQIAKEIGFIEDGMDQDELAEELYAMIVSLAPKCRRQGAMNFAVITANKFGLPRQ